MKQLPLSGRRGKGRFAIVDDDVFGRAMIHTWYLHPKGYAVAFKRDDTRKPTGLLKLHHLVLMAPKGLHVDHKSCLKLDCRRENLRIATISQNTANQFKKSGSVSKYKGVTYYKRTNRWHARITIRGGRVFLGSYENESDAARAYNDAAAQLFGEYARLNLA